LIGKIVNPDAGAVQVIAGSLTSHKELLAWRILAVIVL
jgi:hypothetical protein